MKNLAARLLLICLLGSPLPLLSQAGRPPCEASAPPQPFPGPAGKALDLPEAVLTLPVVFHIVHNGQPVGDFPNLAYARVLSQLAVLEEDFRRQIGTPGFNSHPDGGDMEIEFCPALQAPDGSPLPEPGVNRIARSSQGWAAPPYTLSYARSIIQPASQWDPRRYINIWVLPTGNNLLGYAQFPDSSGLSGLSTVNGSASTDGLIIGADYFGRGPELAPPFNGGRTLTHEMGHFLGLFHTWADGPCNVDDGCNDTPEGDWPIYGCPTGVQTCGLTRMVENYMEYTDDACMSVFTLCQKSRMRTVLQVSPRRKELVSSPVCSGSFAPQARFSVSDSAPCAGSSVQFLDESLFSPSGWQWSFPGGIPATSYDPNPLVQYPQAGSYDVSLRVFNGAGSDTLTYTGRITVQAGGRQTLYAQDFEAGWAGWSTQNPDNALTWTLASVGGASSGSQAAFMGMYFYANPGARDYLLSPWLSLSGFGEPRLRFEHAYRAFPGAYDSLIVSAAEPGGSWLRLYANAENGSGNFASAPPLNGSFTPAQASDWCFAGNNGAPCIELSLAAFEGEDSVRLRFEAVNAYGNNLYLDRVELSGLCRPGLQSLEATEGLTFRIAPNPARGSFSLWRPAAEARLELRILGMDGRTHWAGSWPAGEPQLRCEVNLPPGLYLVRVQGPDAMGAQPLLIE
jgi:PKD repeat protein